MSRWIRASFPDGKTPSVFVRELPRAGDHVCLPESLAAHYGTDIALVTAVIHYMEDHEKIDMQKPDINLTPVKK